MKKFLVLALILFCSSFSITYTGGSSGGLTGLTGPTGNNAYISVNQTIVVIPSSNTPYIINTGTSANAVFQFYLPQSVTGNTGPQGNTGVTGAVIVSGDVQPQLINNLDLGNYGLTFHSTAGEAISAGSIGFVSSDTKVYNANASAFATQDRATGQLLISLDGLSANGVGRFIAFGGYTTSGLTAGSVYFLGTTNGTITTTAPASTGQYIRAVGRALKTTLLFFSVDPQWIIHS